MALHFGLEPARTLENLRLSSRSTAPSVETGSDNTLSSAAAPGAGSALRSGGAPARRHRSRRSAPRTGGASSPWPGGRKTRKDRSRRDRTNSRGMSTSPAWCSPAITRWRWRGRGSRRSARDKVRIVRLPTTRSPPTAADAPAPPGAGANCRRSGITAAHRNQSPWAFHKLPPRH